MLLKFNFSTISMKNYFCSTIVPLLIFIFVGGSVFAQQATTPEKPSPELAVDALNLLSNKTLSVLYRTYAADGTVKRYSGSISGSINTQIDSPSLAFQNNLNIDLMYGKQKYLSNDTKFGIYTGLDYRFRYGMNTTNNSTQTSIGANQTMQTRSRSFNQTVGLGITPFLGAEYRIKPQISLGAELRLPVLLSWNTTMSRTRRTTTNDASGTVASETITHYPTDHGFSLNFNGSTASTVVCWLSFRLK